MGSQLLVSPEESVAELYRSNLTAASSRLRRWEVQAAWKRDEMAVEGLALTFIYAGFEHLAHMVLQGHQRTTQ